MNIKTLEVCSLVPAGEMGSRRWKTCNHTSIGSEYYHGNRNTYCKDCAVDLEPKDNPWVRKQASNAMKTKYTNLKLKENFNVRRKDTFICWNCYGAYRNNSNNALTNSKYCPKCRDIIHNFQRENKHYDVTAVKDLGLQGLRENTVRSDLIANGIELPKDFNQDDNSYSGLGRYTNGKPKKNSHFEQKQIDKAYNDINKYSDGEYLNQPSKSKKKSKEEDLNGLWFDEDEGDINEELEDFYDD